MKFDGFLKLADRKDEEKDKKVPALEKGTALNLIRVNEAVQHFTEPPANFTEATLVKELEEKGIGRPSTYSPIIRPSWPGAMWPRKGRSCCLRNWGN